MGDPYSGQPSGCAVFETENDIVYAVRSDLIRLRDWLTAFLATEPSNLSSATVHGDDATRK